MEEQLSSPSSARTVLDHTASDPQAARLREAAAELERVTRSRAYFDDTDPVNRAIRQSPTRAMFVAAGVGFVLALLTR